MQTAGKARNIDFVLRETYNARYIFRFYPRASHCHGFGDRPPKTIDEIYKVYYSYAIIRQYINDGKIESTQVIWKSECDECSAIDSIAYVCDKVSSNIFHEIITLKDGDKKVFNYLDYDIFPMGDGIVWNMKRQIKYNHWDENDELLDDPIKYFVYQFTMTKYNGVSYVFTLHMNQVKMFGEYLQKCCDYMLEHGEPI